jgi:hypothetical protein
MSAVKLLAQTSNDLAPTSLPNASSLSRLEGPFQMELENPPPSVRALLGARSRI